MNYNQYFQNALIAGRKPTFAPALINEVLNDVAAEAIAQTDAILAENQKDLDLMDPEDPKYVFSAGAFMRWKDAMIPVAKMEYKPFTISVSYDANVSQLKTASNSRGGFELSISYQTFLNSPVLQKCPTYKNS